MRKAFLPEFLTAALVQDCGSCKGDSLACPSALGGCLSRPACMTVVENSTGIKAMGRVGAAGERSQPQKAEWIVCFGHELTRDKTSDPCDWFAASNPRAQAVNARSNCSPRRILAAPRLLEQTR